MAASHVIATRSGNLNVEARSNGWPSSGLPYGWTDPAAIPPPGLGSMQRAGVVVTADSLLQVDVVFTAMRIITTAILKMGDPRAYDEALSPDNIPYRKFCAKQPALLTDTFGGRLMQYDGRRRTLMSMGLFGEAFWLTLTRDRLGYPEALDVLHPAFMDVQTDEQNQIKYVYGPANDRRVLDPDDVTHIPFMAMPQSRRALSTVNYAGVAGALAMAAYEFGSTWFSQGAAPSFLLSTEQKLGPDEIRRIAQKFVIEHSGLASSHLPLVLDSGLQATKVMANPDEAQYLSTLEYARNVIASWFGVPETLLPNALQRQPSPAAHTAEEETQRFLMYTLGGYTIPLEEAYASLLPDGQKVVFDDSQIMRPDSQFLAQLVMNLRQSQVASVNDLRTRMLGWAPVEGGDQVIAPLASNTAPEQTTTATTPAEPDAS